MLIFFDMFSWEEFCQDVEIEKAGLYIELATDKGLSSPQVSFILSGRQNQQPAGAEKTEPLMKIQRCDGSLSLILFNRFLCFAKFVHKMLILLLFLG